MIKSLLNTLLFCLFAIVASAQFTLEDSLQLFYPFNGNANDASGNGFNGTVNNGAALTTDRFGNANSAYSFDGTNDWIDTDETFDYEFRTVSVWFYPEDSTSRSIINQDANTLSFGAFSSTITSSNHLNARAGGLGSKVIVPNIGTGNWYHLVLQRNADSVFYYINGVLVADSTANSGGSVANANAHTVIGVHRNESSQYFDGKIDDIRIYNRRLSQCEINQLYCAAAPCISPQDTSILLGTALTFENIGGEYDSISWSINGNVVSNDTILQYVFDSVGLNMVVVYAEDSNCSGTDTIYVNVSGVQSCFNINHRIKISDDSGGFSGVLSNDDIFGMAVRSIGDLNGDGINELAVGAPRDGDGGTNAGAVYILFMNSSNTVDHHVKISADSGGFGSGLSGDNFFGTGIAPIGDLNNDGVIDLAVGSPYDNDGGTDRGAVWILFLDSNGNVDSKQKISDVAGSFSGTLDNNDRFGVSVTGIGDFNSDGNEDICVGAVLDDDGNSNSGALWIIYLNSNGTVDSWDKISNSSGGLSTTLANDERLGASVGFLGDLDNDGAIELVSGAIGYDVTTNGNNGAVYLLSIDTSGEVISEKRITQNQSGFLGSLDNSGSFGIAVSDGEDSDNNGFKEFIVGNWTSDETATDDGVAWRIEVSTQGYVLNHQKIGNGSSGLGTFAQAGDRFGCGATFIPDINNDGLLDMAIGAREDDDGGSSRGAFYLFLSEDTCCTAESIISGGDTILELPATISFVNNGTNGDSMSWSINGQVISNSDTLNYNFTNIGHYEIVLTTISTCVSRDTVKVIVPPTPPCLALDSARKISDIAGNFQGVLDNNDRFSRSMAGYTDIDGNGINNLIVTSYLDDDGGSNRGALYMLNLDETGMVIDHHKISSDSGGFGTGLQNTDQFGSSVANIGDLNGDGYADLAVGAPRNDDNGTDRGSIWILFMDSAGLVSSKQKISDSQGGLTYSLANDDRFGFAVCPLGDLNGDGNVDIAVSIFNDDEGATNSGTIIILYLNSDGTVHHESAINNNSGNLPYTIGANHYFGSSLAFIGDYDGDGTKDIVAGSHGYDSSKGAIYLLSLDTSGLVTKAARITQNEGGFTETLNSTGKFGDEVDVSDVEGDGYFELLVGNWNDNDGGTNRGALWILSIDSTGYVFSHLKVSSTQGGFTGTLANNDLFGRGISAFDDFNNDGIIDIAVGVTEDDDGGSVRGAVYVIPMIDTCCTANSLISSGDTSIALGSSLSFSNLGMNGDSITWHFDGNLYSNDSSISLNFSSVGLHELVLTTYATCISRDTIEIEVDPPPPCIAVDTAVRISNGDGNFTGDLDGGDLFGFGLDAYIDLNGDGTKDLLIGAPYDDDGGSDRGAIYVTLMNMSGTVQSHHKISSDSGNFGSGLANGDRFGEEIATIGDLNDDGFIDIAVSAPGSDDGGSNKGAIWILFLDSAGEVDSKQKISDTQGSFTGTIGTSTQWGNSIAGIGDLNNDGVEDIIVGHAKESDGGTNAGAAWVLFMNTDGTVDSHQKISNSQGSLGYTLSADDHFGGGASYLGDYNIDGYPDVIVAAHRDDVGSNTDVGSFYILSLDTNGTVHSSTKITENEGGFDGTIGAYGTFGQATTSAGDINQDGFLEILVSEWRDNDGANEAGACWILSIDSQGYVFSNIKISNFTTNFNYTLSASDRFGVGLCAVGDLNQDGIQEIAVGARGTDLNGTNVGATYIISLLDTCCTVEVDFTQSDSNICVGETVSFSDNSTGTSTPTYTWLLNDSVVSTSSTLTYTFNSPGIYGIKLLIDDICDRSKFIFIEVNQNTASIAFGDTAICDGDTAQLMTSNALGYLWSNGATLESDTVDSPMAFPTSNTIYYVTMTDSNTCKKVDSVLVELNPIPSVQLTGDSTICLGDSAQLSATGAISYYWSPNNNISDTIGTSVFVFPIQSTTYRVSGTDSNGCSNIDSISIHLDTTLQSTVSSFIEPSCNGFSDGKVFGSGTGGTLPYSFEWSNGSTIDSILNIPSDTYNLTITDANGCADSTSIFLDQPDSLSINESVSDVSCFGGNNGSITATASGGTSGYSYSWSNSQTGATITSLSAGTYTVTANDANGCTTAESYNIDQPTILTASINLDSNASCAGGSDGAATASSTGGSLNYSYSWSNGATSATNSGLSADTYSVTVTDANGCTDSTSIAITEPVQLTVSISNVTDASCFGGNDGTATASTTGGTGTISYAWSNGQSNSSATNLSAGSHTVTATDANGCTAIADTTISEPTAIAITLSGSNVLCNGDSTGSATATASGGTGTITFNWSTGSTSNSITSIPAGTYVITATDANSCEAIDSITITEPTQLVASISSTTSVLCNSGNDGTATASVTGGTTSYTYAWNTGASGVTATGLTAGLYTVTVTDALGCTDTAIANVTEPNVLIATVILDSNVSCANGSDGAATASAAGGSPNYSYSWSNGATSATNSGLTAGSYSVTITDANGCTDSTSIAITEPVQLTVSISNVTDASCYGGNDGIATASTTGGTGTISYAWSNGQSNTSATNLSAGSYTVTATDANGCTAIADTTISEPTAIAITLSGSNVLCNGDSTGSATATASGGTGTITFNWSTGSTSNSITSIPAGTYIVTATDANSCETIDSITLTEPAQLVASISSTTSVLCNSGNDGTATASATGGTTAYAYAWNTGASSVTATGLTAGQYTVTVTDAFGCTDTANANVTEPNVLIATLILDSNVSCANGSDGAATASAAGGSPNYSYSWSNGATSATNSGLTAGSYSVTITDANGCTDITSISIDQPNPISISFAVTSPIQCIGDSNGSLYAQVSGGNGNFNYTWNNGGSDSIANGLYSALYSVTVTDTNGCVATDSFILTQPTAVSAMLDSTVDVLCNGLYDGLAFTSAAGGTGAHSFLWNNGDTLDDIDSLTSGTYALTVSDANGCEDSLSVTIIELDPIIPNLTATDVSCYDGTDGLINSSVTGGGSTFNYSWSNGQIAASATALASNTYTLTISDENNCIGIDSAFIDQPDSLFISLTAIDALCIDSSNGSIQSFVTGGTLPYSYLWSTGSVDSVLVNLDSGLYSLTIADDNGCVKLDSATIGHPEAITSTTITIDSVSCFGDSNGMGVVIASGGVGILSYTWSTGANTDTLSNVWADLFSVTISDTNNCLKFDSVEIYQPDSIQTNTDSLINVSCHGGSNGYFEIAVNGGTSPYQFSWSNGENESYTDTLVAGLYYVTVIDANGCLSVHQDSIFEPDSLIVQIVAAQQINCIYDSIGSLSSIISGGTAGYQYSWSSGDNAESIVNLDTGHYSLSITDTLGCAAIDSFHFESVSSLNAIIDSTNNLSCFNDSSGFISVFNTDGVFPIDYSWSNGGTDSAINQLLGGTYYYTVTDSLGCIDSGFSQIIEPTQIFASIDSSTNIDCFGDDDGMAFGSAIGGTAPYSYSWSSGGINDSVGQLDSGWHYLQVTDTLGCQSIDSVFIEEPTDTIQFNFSTIDAYCFDGLVGSILAAPSGATSPYDLNWNTGDTTSFIENLAADTYYLTITDGNGCVYTNSDTVFEPNGPDTAILDIEHISCNGLNDGSISVTFVGGVAPYSYEWSTGDTTQSLTNLATDTFSVTLRDSVMCMQIATGIVLEPDSLIAKVALSSGILCHGDSNGALVSETSGGTLPYSYLWSNTEIDSSISGLDTGIYTLTITDTNGCVDSTEFMLSQPDSLSIDSVYLNQPTCYGLFDGSILVVTSGGVQPYNYQWTNLAIDSLNEGIGAGAYGISISDLNGCSLDSLFVLEQPDPVVMSATELSPTQCSNSNSGEASVSGVGGVGDLSFLWSNGSNGDTIISLYHGKYYVTGSDENGCESYDSVVINYLHQAPIFDLGTDTSACNVDSILIGIDSSYTTMLWSNQLEGSTITVSESGEYNLSVTDIHGCSWTDSILISLNFSTPLDLIDDTTLCSDIGETSIILDSDTEFQHYLWSNGDSTSTILVDSSGMYWLVATNSAGCVSSDTTNISITTCYPFPEGCDGKSLIAYPVPSMNQVILETCFWPLGETQFTIYDLQGRMVDMFEATERYTTLDISYYPAGVYVVKAIGPGVYEKVRIVKI